MNSKELFLTIEKHLAAIEAAIADTDFLQIEISDREGGLHMDALRKYLDMVRGRNSTCTDRAKELVRKPINAEQTVVNSAEAIARERWNSEADEYNQWDSLGQDEKDELIAKLATIPAVESAKFSFACARALYSEIIASGLEYARECLAKHETNLGRETLKNKNWAETMEEDIRNMERTLEMLRACRTNDKAHSCRVSEAKEA
jgi:vacuolar-type H+-ATPase subunit I/STV1